MRCLWLSRLARPDIAFAVQRLASRATKWTRWEDGQTHRLISYLHVTSEHVMKLSVDPNQRPSLSVYTDSDFASCPHTAKSTSGIVYVKFGQSSFPVMRHRKKQSSTAQSTTGRVHCMRRCIVGETLNLHSLIEALVEIRVPIIFKRDNQTTITVIRSGYSAKLRSANRVHRVNLASVHEQLEGGVFDMEYCNTELQLANALTKVVAPQHWSEALAQLCVQL